MITLNKALQASVRLILATVLFFYMFRYRHVDWVVLIILGLITLNSELQGMRIDWMESKMRLHEKSWWPKAKL